MRVWRFQKGILYFYTGQNTQCGLKTFTGRLLQFATAGPVCIFWLHDPCLQQDWSRQIWSEKTSVQLDLRLSATRLFIITDNNIMSDLWDDGNRNRPCHIPGDDAFHKTEIFAARSTWWHKICLRLPRNQINPCTTSFRTIVLSLYSSCVFWLVNMFSLSIIGYRVLWICVIVFCGVHFVKLFH